MVQLPNNFIAIRFEGYFLNIDNMCLYSLKQTGTLRELKHYTRTYFRPSSGYNISKQGRKETVTDEYLQTTKLQYLETLTITIIKITHEYSKDKNKLRIGSDSSRVQWKT